MEIVVHRVNTLEKLNQVPDFCGCEIDVRADGKNLILNHNPFESGESLLKFLDGYGNHKTLILNIKTAGVEDLVLEEVRKRGIASAFLLDVEFPYIYRAVRSGERAIAIRYSEDEPIEAAKVYAGKLDWVWIDTNTRLPLNADSISVLRQFNTCLVCPERWGRPQDIPLYRKQMQELNFSPDAVMTALEHIDKWLR